MSRYCFKIFKNVIHFMLLIFVLAEINLQDIQDVSEIKKEMIKLTLYYESLCPYCSKFILGQLTPTYKLIGDYILLDLIPFGNAELNKNGTKWSFSCQHGGRECFENKVQACILNLVPEQEKQLNFIYCVTSQDDPSLPQAQIQCAENFGINWKELEKCTVGEQGDEYLAKYGIRTNEFNPNIVPIIVFNDTYDHDLYLKAVHNLLPTICNLYADKPEGCQ